MALAENGGALDFYPMPSDKKIAVLFATWCGSSRDAAVWISEGMGGIAKVFDVRENPDLTSFDHIVVGGSIRSGVTRKELQDYIAKNKATLKGKVVLVNFWAAWCTPCADEVPKLVGLQDKYGRDGFQTIGISMEDKESALRGFYHKYRMNYPVVIGSPQIAQDYGGILGLPTTFLVGRDGRIHSKYSGLVDFSQLEQQVVALLRTGK